MNNRKTTIVGAASAAVLLAALSASIPVQAGNTGAFVGGMLTSRVLHNMNDRTEAEQEQAYYAQQQAQQPVQQAAPAASSSQSTEAKLDELNKLAAGGYITPEEYKAKKQAIIDAM